MEDEFEKVKLAAEAGDDEPGEGSGGGKQSAA